MEVARFVLRSCSRLRLRGLRIDQHWRIPVRLVILPRVCCQLSSDSQRRTLCMTAAPSRLCWKCQKTVSGAQLFCSFCHSLQPPDENRDYFQILDCDKSFTIDILDLQLKYRNLQRLLHPDYFSQKSQSEQEISENQSSLVNKAYNTLLSPLSRGIYLLSLNGITFKDGAESGDVDTEFLFEILEINEDLNEVSTDSEIEEIGKDVQDKLDILTEDVRNAFHEGDFQEAKFLLEKMKYYSNILDQVKKKILP
ncbi:iron-sulfur cluster co-chaperone protein HscB [Bombina bombina]|uniref:iron-sulfur cluster co-chaperone protein HscB n=1 Tax=Bombina bombina TaxID=8345 RepID=UPI00235AB24C|nr:iron-sulfur cluster co-chaperone protein HscB [Bombina bombina]